MATRIRTTLAIALLVGELATAGTAFAQYAYPAKGQSQAQQQKDESYCSNWATQQTGFDPMNPPQPAQASAAPVTGSGARVKGAAVGAGIGAISGGDAGDAAVAGAVAGGVIRRGKNRRAARAQNEANAAAVAGSQAGFDQARASCLSGRGYTLK
jgi:hypothetical protein